MPGLELPGRPIDDPAAVRQSIFDRALETASAIQPVSNARHTLTVTDAGYEGPERFSVSAQKKAILEGGSLGRRLRGTLTLQDTVTGAPVATRRATLATIPYYTDRGTFIDNGSEYTLGSQLRMKPGVFHRQKDSGDLEAHVSTLPGKGVPHRLFLDPKTGVFRIRVEQANLPLVPLLQAMGMKDADFREMWGSDLAAVNLQKSTGADVSKLYRKIVRNGKSDDPNTQRQELAAAMQNTLLDPDVSRQTLGQPFDRVSTDSIRASTRKLLAIQNRDNPDYLSKHGLEAASQDDRDHLAYMMLHGPEDMIAERLGRGSRMLKQVLWKSGRRNNLDHVTAGMFDRDVRSAYLGSGLGQTSESINPLQVFEQQMRVSRLGQGAIANKSAVPSSSRAVQPSYLGAIDLITTPESESAGVDIRMVRNLRKGRDGEMYQRVRDVRTGELVWKQPKELQDAVVAFPRAEKNAFETNAGMRVPAMRGGKASYVPADSVQYQLPHMEQAFNPTANLVPLKSAMKGQRVAMGARFLTQSLPLNNPESALVQSGVPDEDDKSYDESLGERMGAVRAKAGGRVRNVTPDGLEVQYDDGTTDMVELASHLPANRKTMFHQEAAVQAGQRFEAGSLLAKSNYTDANGVTALGKNARVGYISARGKNYEDSILVSRSFADRMDSNHLYQSPVEINPDSQVVGRNKFLGIFPGKFNKQQLETVDDNGVVRVGQRVEFGDPLVLVAGRRQARVGEVSRSRAHAFSDQTETWTHHTPGIVTDVAKTKTGWNVAVKTSAVMQEGDKAANRFGGKGVVNVIPDDQMPIAEDGRPLEVLMNSHGIISRSNPSQAIETWLGKVAEKTGKPYKIKDFEDIDDLAGFAQQELSRHGLKGTETLTDPVTGRKIPGVLTGSTYMLKLHHVSEAKASGRTFGRYDQDGVPAKGGDDGSKTFGMLHLNAILSHGATGVIRDASLVRGQRNNEYWAAVMSGRNPPDPPTPLVYQKFVEQLRATGINPKREGTRTQLMALTNANIDQLAENRVLGNSKTVEWQDDTLRPIKGGLFDESLFGGAAGNRWARLPLVEPFLNPVMERPALKLLDLKEREFRDIIAGRKELGGKTGPKAIGDALSSINIDRAIEQAKIAIKSSRSTVRNAAVQKLGYLNGVKQTGVPPSEWMWNSVPVMPPQFRPVGKMGGGDVPLVSDANFLYKDLFDTHENLKWSRDNLGDHGDDRLATYDAIKAVTGLGDPAPVKLQEQKVQGVLKHILGNGPKNSIVQRRLLGNKVDLVGRGTVLANPDLGLDEVAIPEEQAWKVYQPFVVRELVKRGLSPARAAIAVAGKQDVAKRELLGVMSQRPVILDRSPVLHRYGVMAFWPKLTKGSNIETNSAVNKGFTLDHDGDAMSFHVPAHADAVKDAIEKMLPSKNLFNVSQFKVHQLPQQEYLGGLYAASTARSDKRSAVFATRADAIKAYHRGEIDPGQQIQIVNEKE
jgi:DNA-directed RNA polymerase subunit beta